jgi:hypothetical protein
MKDKTPDRLRELGKVERVQLTLEDHGILTLWLHLVFNGSGQGFGGRALDAWDEAKNRRVGTALGLDYILQMLALFKVDTLGAIKGRYVYALRNEPYGDIIGLELPEPDGSTRFVVEVWLAEWLPKREQ